VKLSLATCLSLAICLDWRESPQSLIWFLSVGAHFCLHWNESEASLRRGLALAQAGSGRLQTFDLLVIYFFAPSGGSSA